MNIKIRFWDKKKKRMVYEMPYGTFFYPNGEIYNSGLNKSSEWGTMVFTGLFDKNDKEMWEGDVFRDQYGDEYEIAYDANYAEFTGIKRGNPDREFDLDYISAKEIEVVGHKYELMQEEETWVMAGSFLLKNCWEFWPERSSTKTFYKKKRKKE